MNSDIDPETRINIALGKVLRYFNFLELNLGFCIRSLENPEEPEQSHLELYQSSIKDKLKLFKDLLASQNLITDQEEFDTWYQEVGDARCIRNYYVHGTWEYLPLRSEKPLGFRIPPWRTEDLRGETKLSLSLDELEADAQQIQLVFEKFEALRRKYGI